MQFFRSSLSRLAFSAMVGLTTVAIAPEAVDARQPCGSFTINWGGTVRPGDILDCAVEWNSGPRRSDRYYLDIKKSKIVDNFRSFELSFPKEFDGEVNDEKIRVRVNGKEVDLIAEETSWDPTTAPVQSNAQRTRAAVSSIENAAAPSPRNTGGELTIDADGNLVFLEEPIEQDPVVIETVTPTEETVEEDDDDDENQPRSRSLFITLAEPLEPESKVEIILDDVDNPSSGGIYLVTAFARSQGAPLPNKLGAWFIDIDF